MIAQSRMAKNGKKMMFGDGRLHTVLFKTAVIYIPYCSICCFLCTNNKIENSYNLQNIMQSKTLNNYIYVFYNYIMVIEYTSIHIY